MYTEFYLRNYYNIRFIDGFNNINKFHRNLYITNNDNLKKINGFNSVIETEFWINISDNKELVEITGFENIIKFSSLYIENNPKFVAMSIPGNLLRATNHRVKSSVRNEFKSPEEFINSPVIIDDLVEKFNPDIHSDLVIKQIMENLVKWGTEETQCQVIPYLIHKGVEHPSFQSYLNKYDPGTIKSNNNIIREIYDN